MAQELDVLRKPAALESTGTIGGGEAPVEQPLIAATGAIPAVTEGAAMMPHPSASELAYGSGAKPFAPRPFRATPESEARAEELKNRAGGAFIDQKKWEGRVAPNVAASATFLADFMRDKNRSIHRLQELEDRVAQRVEAGVSHPEAIEAELTAMEAKHDLPPAMDLEDKSYSDAEWSEMLSQGRMFRDTAFKSQLRGAHGMQTHRMQWWMVMREMESVDPKMYGNKPVSELLRDTGTRVGDKNRPEIWSAVFDNFGQSPSTPVWFHEHRKLLPGLGSEAW